jgi:hypothetical protein
LVPNGPFEHVEQRCAWGEAATLSRAQQNGSKMAFVSGVKQGHFHPGVKGSLRSKDVASVRETLSQCRHKDYLCFQRNHPRLPLVCLTSSVFVVWLCSHSHATSSSETPLGRPIWSPRGVEHMISLPLKAWMRKGAALRFLCNLLACQTGGHGNRPSAANSLQECHCTLTPAPPRPPTARPRHDCFRK